jgi:ABC-type transport system involved in multi-copper enzyme maturation permease subunit
MMVALAAWQIRIAALKQAGTALVSSRRRFSLGFKLPTWLPRLPGPSLDGNPVLWREWQRFRPTRFLRVTWALYTAMGATFTLVALLSKTTIRAQSESISIMTMFQVAIGLLLLSVSAATSLAQERARGSLDVLLSTPLSTCSILVGKWWGAFRLAPHVIFWPAVLAGILVYDGGSWFAYFLLLSLILAYCVAIASLGLALSTWISRLGRSVTICVALCVGFSFCWMFLVMSLFNRDQWGVPLIMGSPLYGTASATSLITQGPTSVVGSGTRPTIVGALLWITVHSGTALMLFAATLATFNSCLGRTSDSARPRNPVAGKKPPAGAGPDFVNSTGDDWLQELS